MALPQLKTPTYELKLKTIQEPIKYRPFLVKEEKILMIASETGDEKNIINAIGEIVTACTFGKVKSGSIPIFDLEYLFLNIRGKAIGEKIKVNVKCPDDMKTMVETEIDIGDIKLNETEKHTNVVEITDEIKLVLKYPTMNMVSKLNLNDPKELFKVIPKMIESVYEGEKIIEDFSEKEADDFISSLNSQQFLEVQKFFETMPKLKHMVKIKNPKTEVESDVPLEGLQSFF